jgi:cytochrome c oxidase accessory protein FixG
LLVISALSLFLFTAVAGRLWCGYACPQTVYSEIFMWIERKVEGDRSARMRLDAGDFSLERLVKKWYKHTVWLGLAMWTGFTFVGYFTPIQSLGLEFLQTRMTSWEVFWVFFYGLATYGNAGFMREQVCKYMCPYARFQSAMFDADTLIVTYDAQRGEPRGRHTAMAEAHRSTGDCIDCSLCVQVCPTGIDIRQGLQYECIGCGACADVCDTVMDKVGSAQGLVRYATQNAIQKSWSTAHIWRRVLRWRVVIYTGFLTALVIGLGVSLALRSPFRVDIVRDRTTLSRITEYGTLQNVYRLQIMNATEHSSDYQVSVRGLSGIELRDKDPIHVAAAQARWVVVHVDVPYGSGETGSHKIWFDINDPHSGKKVVEASVFLIPR